MVVTRRKQTDPAELSPPLRKRTKILRAVRIQIFSLVLFCAEKKQGRMASHFARMASSIAAKNGTRNGTSSSVAISAMGSKSKRKRSSSSSRRRR